MVLFDNNVLCLLLHPDADVPNDPATDKPVEQAHQRVEYLREQLQDAGVRILIPTPVLSEFLTFADSGYLTTITQTMWFEIGSFDRRAAIEAAVALRRALNSPLGKKLGSSSPWQKIKVDRQIVAVGRAYGVTHVYSTDADVLSLAHESGIEASHVADLPLPPKDEIQLTLEDLAASHPSSQDASAPSPPFAPSPADGTPTGSQLAPAHPADLQADPKQLPPGSSPAVPPPPPSKK